MRNPGTKLGRCLEGLVAAILLCSAAAAARGGKSGTGALEAWPETLSASGDRPAFRDDIAAPAPAGMLRRAGLGWIGGDPRTGWFRVTVRGFRVVRESSDDMLQRDGRGDEIYIRGDVFAFDLSARAPAGLIVTTERIWERVTGSSYPTADPATGRGGDPRPRDLPLVIWEGELTQRADAVVIVPTIWEWDGATATAEEARWERSVRPAMIDQTSRIQGLIQRPDSRPIPVFNNILSLDISDDGTRPIGSPRRQTPAVPMRIPVILLTFDSAQELSYRTLEEPVYGAPDGGAGSSTNVRLPRGVLPIEFADPEGLEGQYILYLHVELVRLTR